MNGALDIRLYEDDDLYVPPQYILLVPPLLNELMDVDVPLALGVYEGEGEVEEVSLDRTCLTCPVCYDMIYEKPASSTVCGHIFCTDCIVGALAVRKLCPLCKRRLHREDEVHPVFFN